MYYLHKKGYRVSLDSPSDTKCNRLQAYKRNNGKINNKNILQNHLVHKIVHGIVCARVDDHVACVRVYDVKYRMTKVTIVHHSFVIPKKECFKKLTSWRMCMGIYPP
jgi:hypothetical protein